FEVCKRCQNTEVNDTKTWQRATEEVDAISRNIDIPFKVIEQGLIKAITQKEESILSFKELQIITLGVTIGLLILFPLYMIRWSNRKIVSPIETLSSLASKENISANDFKLNGPKEIKNLSEKFGNYILALVKARKISEEESKLSRYANARVRNVVETAGDAIICTNINGDIIEMNESFRNLSKININKYPHPTLKDFIPELELNDFETEYTCMLISFTEATLYTKNGLDIPVEISTSSFESNGERLFTIIIRDITDRKELLEQLLQAQKLESIGRMAAGIAHEINTPAQYIMDYNRFIKDAFDNLDIFLKKAHELNIRELEDITEELGLDFYEEEVPNAITGSLFGLEQISKIVKSVKGFTHPNNGEKTIYNLNKIVKDTINVSRNEWKYDCEIDLQLDSNLPDIECFPVRLNQVILNMIVNSAQSIHEKMSEKEQRNKGLISIITEEDEANVIIKIKDNGKGIPDSIKNKIFDPFFTTKEVGVGTGQGLAISYDFIVKKHSGELNFESLEDQGTEFTISLPKMNSIQRAS
ncbi:MAG: ATP-binding protein, partial [Lentisphaeraceae bacterium]|nr:ATP-binding protein [Lentisphaeraceae bacterium]